MTQPTSNSGAGGSSGAGGITPAQFVAKWSKAELSERAASQEHFIDLCRMLGQPTPADHDATGAEYAFEKGVAVTGGASKAAKGDHGFADVWWRGKFGWEYKRKGKHRHLDDAYRQLCQYREALDNPPLLIVCDIARTEIHTNFTGTAKQVHVIELADLAEPHNLTLLRRVFTDPDSFKPTLTAQGVTEKVANQFGELAHQLRKRGNDAHDTAHFLMRCMFCLFAEDVDLLPSQLFSRMLKQWHDNPHGLTERLTELFEKMAIGGAFGFERIPWFNGGLFKSGEPALELTESDIGVLMLAAAQDWSSVEPAIFGTLFERSLDPTKRAQIGAHYTSRDDILLIVEPVVMAPLRRRWDEVRQEIVKQLERRRDGKTAATRRKADEAIEDVLQGYLHDLAAVRILDPACGSGNFLYVAIQQLLDLEKQVITFAATPEVGLGLFPRVRPTQLHGIEINPYAAELAQVVIWIGYLQWMRDNGFNAPRDPILEPLQTIENRDAILDLSNPDHPTPAKWPEADYIIGNPPFLGSKVFRLQGLDDAYVSAMYSSHELIPNSADLCCYWFELARQAIEKHPATRAGLLATQSIRGGTNRKVLERIKKTGSFFMAWADREWVLDGASVHVSMVGFDDGRETTRVLDGVPVSNITPMLTGDLDTSVARKISENESIGFMGDTKVGPFDIDHSIARKILGSPNPLPLSNELVVRPWTNGLDITRRPRAMWIVDFPPGTSLAEASNHEAPFDHVETHVRPMRKTARSGDATGVDWWIHQRPRPDMRKGIESLSRFIATPNLTKHRLFTFMAHPTLPDHQLIAFARSDNYFFGVLHSSLHETWSLRMGTQLETRPRYTPTTCFETFAMPWSPGKERKRSAIPPLI